MTEVEKLYENVGINKTICKYAKYGYEGEEGTWYLCTKNSSNGINLEDRECWTYPTGNADCVEKEYPPFTAEKQLELIKKLGNINIDIDNGCYMSSEILKVEAHCTEFEETLAEFINNLWQSLTEQEQQQIKEILQ